MFDWHRFVWAWERVLGDERRPASAIPNDELLTIRGAYKFWRDDNRSRRISAEEWLRERAEVFERQGYYKHPEAGQMKITSGFHYEVFGFDSDGNLSADGPFFSAARTFSYESGAYGMTHADYCEHVHPSPHDAQPCLQRLKRGKVDVPHTT